METKEIKVDIPEGYVIDEENSTFECIKFKPKCLTYDDVAKELFRNSKCYYINNNGNVVWPHVKSQDENLPLNGTSKKQLEKLAAINKLMNVAKYLNKDWQPDWDDTHTQKWIIAINSYNNELDVASTYAAHYMDAYFRNSDLAKQAIKILGEDTIRLALSTDW